MATPEQLCQSQTLENYEGELGPNLLPQRRLFLTPELCQWLDNDVYAEDFGRDGRADPIEQIEICFNRMVSGEAMVSEFIRLNPQNRGVWEIKLPDLRVFGWFFKMNIFIACYCDWKRNLIKPATLRPIHYVERVISYRNKLDLNEPKYVKGDVRNVLQN